MHFRSTLFCAFAAALVAARENSLPTEKCNAISNLSDRGLCLSDLRSKGTIDESHYRHELIKLASCMKSGETFYGAGYVAGDTPRILVGSSNTFLFEMSYGFDLSWGSWTGSDSLLLVPSGSKKPVLIYSRDKVDAPVFHPEKWNFGDGGAQIKRVYNHKEVSAELPGYENCVAARADRTVELFAKRPGSAVAMPPTMWCKELARDYILVVGGVRTTELVVGGRKTKANVILDAVIYDGEDVINIGKPPVF